MHSTKVVHGQHTLSVSHNSDWSGDVHLRVYRTEGELTDEAAVVSVTLPGELIVGLVVDIISKAAMRYAESTIEKLSAPHGFLARLIRR